MTEKQLVRLTIRGNNCAKQMTMRPIEGSKKY